LHLIISHHGKVELGWGSSIDPKTPEAIALHHADDMSAKITKSLKPY
jgi:3'-5' exoribonuclease